MGDASPIEDVGGGHDQAARDRDQGLGVVAGELGGAGEQQAYT
jgi:hypothetical protein